MSPAPGLELVQPVFHLGLVLPASADTDPGLWESLDSALREVAETLERLHASKQKEGSALLAGPLTLRCMALLPGNKAARLAAIAEAHGWQLVAFELEIEEANGATFPTHGRFVVESRIEREADDRLALQTAFLDQSDVLIEFDEAGSSLAIAALHRAAGTSDVPVLSTAKLDPVSIRSAFRQALAFDGDDDSRSRQVRQARAFMAIASDPGPGPLQAGPDLIRRVEARLAGALAQADRVANLYGSRARAIAKLRILLGTVASLGVFFAFYFADVTRTFWAPNNNGGGRFDYHLIEVGGYGIDVLAIVLVLALAALTKRRAFYGRFAAARYVAEHLRHTPALAALGATVFRLRARSPGVTKIQDWPDWYLRAVARSLGCPAITLTAAGRSAIRHAFDELVANQARFYEVRAKRFGRRARWLSRLANTFFALGLLAVLLRLSVFVWVPQDAKLRVVASLGTFLCPALASIFVALRTQGEYDKLSIRYAAMAETLQGTLTAEGVKASYADLMDHVRRTVTAMLDEVGEWRSLTKSHTVSQL